MIHMNLPANIYLFKGSNRNTRKWCEICSKLTIKPQKGRHWGRLVIFIVNFELISYFSVSVVDFEQVNFNWVTFKHKKTPNAYKMLLLLLLVMYLSVRWIVTTFVKNNYDLNYKTFQDIWAPRAICQINPAWAIVDANLAGSEA